jgi:hypothetical protein
VDAKSATPPPAEATEEQRGTVRIRTMTPLSQTPGPQLRQPAFGRLPSRAATQAAVPGSMPAMEEEEQPAGQPKQAATETESGPATWLPVALALSRLEPGPQRLPWRGRPNPHLNEPQAAWQANSSPSQARSPPARGTQEAPREVLRRRPRRRCCRTPPGAHRPCATRLGGTLHRASRALSLRTAFQTGSHSSARTVARRFCPASYGSPPNEKATVAPPDDRAMARVKAAPRGASPKTRPGDTLPWAAPVVPRLHGRTHLRRASGTAPARVPWPVRYTLAAGVTALH